jgi:proline iminopeptidase
MEMLQVDGATLAIHRVGDGYTPVVILHGGPGASHDYLRPQMDQLASELRSLVYYDQRGGGQSKLHEGRAPGSVAEHVADLDAVRVHLGMEKLVLVGYSWGGLLALLYALAYPDRVARMALVSCAPARARDRDRMRQNLEAAQARPEVAALKATLDPSDRRARFELAVAGYFVDPKRSRELTPFMVQQRAEQAVWKSLGDYDLLPELAKLDLPAIFIHGAEDPIPIDSARETAAALKADLVELSPCGHVPYIEQPGDLFRALDAFLDP